MAKHCSNADSGVIFCLSTSMIILINNNIEAIVKQNPPVLKSIVLGKKLKLMMNINNPNDIKASIVDVILLFAMKCLIDKIVITPNR